MKQLLPWQKHSRECWQESGGWQSQYEQPQRADRSCKYESNLKEEGRLAGCWWSLKSKGRSPKVHRAIKAVRAPQLNPETKMERCKTSDEEQWAGHDKPNQEFWDPQTTNDSTCATHGGMQSTQAFEPCIMSRSMLEVIKLIKEKYKLKL